MSDGGLVMLGEIIGMSGDELVTLIRKFGQENVESAMILIRKQKDLSGRHVAIPHSFEMIDAILSAIHGPDGAR